MEKGDALLIRTQKNRLQWIAGLRTFLRISFYYFGPCSSPGPQHAVTPLWNTSTPVKIVHKGEKSLHSWGEEQRDIDSRRCGCEGEENKNEGHLSVYWQAGSFALWLQTECVKSDKLQDEIPILSDKSTGMTDYPPAAVSLQESDHGLHGDWTMRAQLPVRPGILSLFIPSKYVIFFKGL